MVLSPTPVQHNMVILYIIWLYIINRRIIKHLHSSIIHSGAGNSKKLKMKKAFAAHQNLVMDEPKTS